MILKRSKCKVCGRPQNIPIAPFNDSHGDEVGTCHYCFIWYAKEVIKFSNSKIPMDDTAGCGERHPTTLYKCNRPVGHDGGHLAVGIAGLVYEAWNYGKAMLQLTKRRKVPTTEDNNE